MLRVLLRSWLVLACCILPVGVTAQSNDEPAVDPNGAASDLPAPTPPRSVSRPAKAAAPREAVPIDPKSGDLDRRPESAISSAAVVPYGPPPPPADAGAAGATQTDAAEATAGAAAIATATNVGGAATVAGDVTSPAAAGARAVEFDVGDVTSPAAAGARAVEFDVAEVRIRDVVILRLKLEDGGLVPSVRAKRAMRAIEAALAEANPESVRTESRHDRVLLFVGPRPVVELTRADAEAIGEGSLELFAASAAAKIRDVLENERQRSVVTRSAFSVALVVFLAVIVLYALRLLGMLARRLRDFVHTNPERIPAIRLRSIEVVGPHVLRSGIVVGLGVLKLLMQVALVFAWLLFSSSLFEATRGMTGRLTALVLTPLSGLATRFVALLPLVLLTTMAAVALVVLLRFVALFFAGVGRRETELNWLRPELAAPTSLLIRIGIVIVSLLVLAPLVTGNVDGSLARVGMLSVVALALAATPLAANVVVGLVTLYGGRVRLGDEICMGNQCGVLMSVDLVELRLVANDGRELRIPHLVTLFRPFSVVDKTSATTRQLIVTAEVRYERLAEILGTTQVFSHPAAVSLVKIENQLTTVQLSPTVVGAAAEQQLLIEVARELEAKQIRLVLAEWRPSA